MKTIVLASSNPGKLTEFKILLKEIGGDIKAQSEFDVSPAEETGLTFVENAILKARHACAETGFAAIADDSGIEVDALRGAPGIYSARFGGEHADDDANNQKLLRELQHVPEEERNARYQCVLVYMDHANDPTPLIAQGSWEGRILTSAVGEGGFGYDPLFWVPSHRCSGAQLCKEEKNRISHRAVAMRQLVAQLTAT